MNLTAKQARKHEKVIGENRRIMSEIREPAMRILETTTEGVAKRIRRSG